MQLSTISQDYGVMLYYHETLDELFLHHVTRLLQTKTKILQRRPPSCSVSGNDTNLQIRILPAFTRIRIVTLTTINLFESTLRVAHISTRSSFFKRTYTMLTWTCQLETFELSSKCLKSKTYYLQSLNVEDLFFKGISYHQQHVVES